jgi:hypothetical protein
MFNIPQVSTILSDGVRQGWVNNVQRHLNRSGNFGMTETGYPLIRQRTITYLAKQPQINTEVSPIDDMRYPVAQFFDCHKKFSDGLNDLIVQDSGRQVPWKSLYNTISDAITDYDQYLIHLHEDILNAFFDYTDLLEAVFLVSKRRNRDITEIRDILIELNNAYIHIYAKMVSNESMGIAVVEEELVHIREEICNRNFMPTNEEYEAEISETLHLET